MIAFWMLWSTWLGLLALVAALVADRVAGAWGRPRRVVWVAAMALIGAVAAGGFVALQVTARARGAAAGGALAETSRDGALDAGRRLTSVRSSVAARGRTLRDEWLARLAPLDVPLAVAWSLATMVLVVRAGASQVALRRRRRLWSSACVDGVDVLVAPDMGPAVVGLRNPALVIPRWLLEYDPALRELVLRHEREHVVARDPLVLAGAVCVAVLLPWNPAVWWALARLRLAVEMDCDARVLRVSPDRRRYGLLLIAVAQARARLDRGALALTPGFIRTRSRTIDLDRRMTAIRTRARPRQLTLVFATAITLGLVAIACETPPPVTQPDSLTTRHVALRAPSMPSKEEILAWIRSNAVEVDSASIEVFDEAAMRRDYGVSKMPTDLLDPRIADAAIRREFAAEAPGQAIAGSVVLEYDIDDTGRVTRLEAIDPRPLPPGVGAVVAVTTDTPSEVLAVRTGSEPPTSPALKRAAVRALTPLLRFAPAELDGRPVPIRGLTMMYAFD